MRPDQIARLNELSEKLADRFLVEADPTEWPGGDLPPADMTQQDRGDSYWCKKNAMATGGVLRYTLDLVKVHQQPSADPADNTIAREADLDRKIKDAERRATEAVNRAVDKARKRTFDAKTHGK